MREREVHWKCRWSSGAGPAGRLLPRPGSRVPEGRHPPTRPAPEVRPPHRLSSGAGEGRAPTLVGAPGLRAPGRESKGTRDNGK